MRYAIIASLALLVACGDTDTDDSETTDSAGDTAVEAAFVDVDTQKKD